MQLVHKLFTGVMRNHIYKNINACRNGEMTREAFISTYIGRKTIHSDAINQIYNDIMEHSITDDIIVDRIVDIIIASFNTFNK